ncbi:hypothetical protein BH10CYA1_BH10CYA1_47960 [soil metagenome]
MTENIQGAEIVKGKIYGLGVFRNVDEFETYLRKFGFVRITDWFIDEDYEFDKSCTVKAGSEQRLILFKQVDLNLPFKT